MINKRIYLSCARPSSLIDPKKEMRSQRSLLRNVDMSYSESIYVKFKKLFNEYSITEERVWNMYKLNRQMKEFVSFRLFSLLLAISICICIFTLSTIIARSIATTQIKNQIGERSDSNLRRIKREFMFASGQNSSDPECFQVIDCTSLMLKSSWTFRNATMIGRETLNENSG